jgi:cytochrome c-type biogenesis protein CcmH
VPVSLGLYLWVTTFDPDAPTDPLQSEMAELDQLAARLAASPDDVNGWVLLGRSYLTLGDYGRARLAFEEAWSRSVEPDNLLKLAYAQSLIFTEEGASLGLAGDLVEDVLASTPGNDSALFLGGIVATERNQPALAVERWTALLATNPPPEIAALIRDQLVQLGASAPSVAAPIASGGPVIELDVSVADSLSLDAFGPGAMLFVIARSSDMPAPIAVERHPLSALPGRFALSDDDAMMPGRVLSNYEQVEVVARISAAGQPTAQSGDASSAEFAIDLAAPEPLELVIDRILP